LGQRDPLVEYKIEAFEIFKEMLVDVGKEVLETIFKMTLVGIDKLDLPEEDLVDINQLQYNHANSQSSISSTKINPDKTGRNDFCPCGSGKKYKKCCLK
jgi:preprotein translocase subunit SecA